MKYISFDIDGIMNDYPRCWISYLNGRIEENVSLEISIEEVKSIVGLELYKKVKDDYRNSDYKANLEFNADAKLLADDFIKEGYKIIISTSRPFNDSRYKKLKTNTINWLKKNSFHFDLFVDKNYELEYLGLYDKIVLHIDDECKYAEQFVSKDIQTFIVGDSICAENRLIKQVSNLNEIKMIWRKYA
jgi:hypothetical protein